MASATLEHLLGATATTRFKDTEQLTSGLPANAYSDEQFFAAEEQAVFRRRWAFAGFVHEVAAPGDIHPVQVGGLPLVLVRGADGVLRVFHNVCRHRGLTLVDAPCNARRGIACPYHGWTYTLGGKLKRAAHFGGYGVHDAAGLDYEANGLVEVRSATWHDWVFVNVDANAGPFEQQVEPLERFIGDRLALDTIEPILKIDSGEVEANWKFLVENFIEPYHVPVTHPGTAAGQPLDAHYMIRDGHLMGCGADIEPDELRPSSPDSLCLDISAWYLCLFPSFLFFVYFAEEIHIYVMINTPLAADRTHQRRVIYQMGGEPLGTAELDAWRQLNCDVIAEDWAMARRLQVGRRSPVTTNGGLMSPTWESSSRAFDEHIVAALEELD